MKDYDLVIEARYMGAIYDKYMCVPVEDKGNNKADVVELINF